jgi:hypothetical protein
MSIVNGDPSVRENRMRKWYDDAAVLSAAKTTAIRLIAQSTGFVK